MKISGGCKDKDIEAVQKTLLEQKLRNEEIISEEIKKSKITMAEVSQKIDLRYDEPLLCVNQCNETPSAGKIRQISNVNIMTRSMIKSIIENTENNILKYTNNSNFIGRKICFEFLTDFGWILEPVSYTHLRANETKANLVWRRLL